MSNQATLLIDSAATQTMGDNVVFPGLAGAVTGSGSAIAAQVTALAMKIYFQGGAASEFTSTTAIAVPSAFTSTTFSGFATTLYGATLMGYGTTSDVTLLNRAGNPVLGVTQNAIGLTLGSAAVAVTIAGTASAAGTDVSSAAITFQANQGTSAGAVGGFVFQVPVTTSTGTTAQTLTNALVLKATTIPMVFAAGTEALPIGLLVTTGGVSAVQGSLTAVSVGTTARSDLLRVNGTLAVPTIILTGQNLGTTAYRGALTATTAVTGASIVATTTENWVASTSSGTKMVLNVTPNTTSGAVAALTLDQDQSVIFVNNVNSVTAKATPSAFAATQMMTFASTVSGAALMGFGTTNDVALMNRAGTVVLGIGPNTTAVNMVGSCAIVGAFACNNGTPQTPAASGGAAPAGGTGATAGAYDTSAHRDALITLVNNMRTALVNCGIMS